VSEADALRFACNAVNLGKTIVLNCISAELERELRGRGFEVVQLELDEFLKAGGAAKCLVMKLTAAMHREEKKLSGDTLMAMEDAYGAHNYHPLDVVIERAQGAWVTDVEGRRYLDFLAAYSAVNQGHCHPKILEAMVEQAQKVTLTSRAFRNDQLPLLLRDLHEATGFEMALPMNSGAEAVETALKAARKWGETVKGIAKDRAEIMTCGGNFHGRTISIVAFSTDAQYRAGFGPFPTGFKTVAFGDAEALREAITPETCAFLVEPIQGEAGIIVPPDGYLKAVAEICRENNVLLIVDEIQSGLGRTGKMFAHEHEGIKPDVVIVGKALSGGFYPVSAVLASREVLGVFQPGDHGSTFGGNPLACAVARAALRVIVEERLAERSAELGAYALERLKAMRSAEVVEVRGRGLWLAIELNVPARPFCEALRQRGVLCKETHETVIRIAPPLTISREDLEWGLEQIEAVVVGRGAEAKSEEAAYAPAA
jgi:ornithine--oxo-acid transaminase